MLDIIIKKSADYLIRHNVIDSTDRDIYEYGFHSLYSNIIIFSIIGLISIALNQFPQTAIYHVAFILLRNNAGGFHAKTQIRCFFMSTIIWIVSLWIIGSISSPTLTICLALFSVIIVWIKAPIEHENNPMREKKYKRMKNRSRLISAILLIIIISMCMLNESSIWLAVSLTVGMVSHVVLFITALFVSRTK